MKYKRIGVYIGGELMFLWTVESNKIWDGMKDRDYWQSRSKDSLILDLKIAEEEERFEDCVLIRDELKRREKNETTSIFNRKRDKDI